MPSKIDPRLIRGFRDFLPAQAIQRRGIIDKVRQIYESFGFQPLETPVLEYADILTGKYGEESDTLLYRFRDKGNRDVAMRYDLTVPFSRVIAMYPQLPKPFKRYQVAPVWRAEKTQKGRYREFYQFDADIAGSESMLADAEIVCLIFTIMNQLGIKNFVIDINNRKVLNGVVSYAGLAQTESKRVFQAIDKLAKIGPEGVKAELLKTGLTTEVANKIMAFTAISGNNRELLINLGLMFANVAAGSEGIQELSQVLDCLAAMGVDETRVRIKTSIARGLDYYTGTVFETTLLDKPEFGSVFSGGRYDELIGLFTGKNMPAVGASVGVDRLFAAMEELELLSEAASVSQVLVTVFPENPGVSLKAARMLRDAGINAEVYLGDAERKNELRKQLRYANQQNIPIVVIIFPEKADQGMTIIRKMSDGTQIEVPLDKLATETQNILKER